MIQIDDAGSGSLIGGTCIGMYNTNTKEYYYDIIPIDLFSLENFKSKSYLNYVIKIVNTGLIKLKADYDTPIEVCRGYIFDRLRIWMNNNNLNWIDTTISGTLQELVEKSFNEYAISLGFPQQYIKYTKYPFHFHRILKWIYADYENRSKLCKTGWKSWQKYKDLQILERLDYIDDNSTYHCLKCGKILNPNKRAKILEFTSNKKISVYIHISCKN